MGELRRHVADLDSKQSRWKSDCKSQFLFDQHFWWHASEVGQTEAAATVSTCRWCIQSSYVSYPRVTEICRAAGVPNTAGVAAEPPAITSAMFCVTAGSTPVPSWVMTIPSPSKKSPLNKDESENVAPPEDEQEVAQPSKRKRFCYESTPCVIDRGTPEDAGLPTVSVRKLFEDSVGKNA